jgi:hypothetical protein
MDGVTDVRQIRKTEESSCLAKQTVIALAGNASTGKMMQGLMFSTLSREARMNSAEGLLYRSKRRPVFSGLPLHDWLGLRMTLALCTWQRFRGHNFCTA